MRAMTHSELARLSRPELETMLYRIAAELPSLPEGSPELRKAHYNLHLIRRALAPRPGFGPR